jgi:hypothetical protein
MWYVHDAMNMGRSVNMRQPAGATLERTLFDALEALLRQVGWLGEVRRQMVERSAADEADAMFRVIIENGGSAELRVHVKKDLRPAAFPAWAAQRGLGTSKSAVRAASVLAMASVSPRLADLCREAGWSWYDLAGNCRIDVPGILHVERTGIAPAWRPPRPRANLGSAASARVMRALLTPAHAGRSWTQRQLQTETCWKPVGKEEPVSLGLVNKVIRHLRDEGLVADVGEHGIRVRDPLGLLKAWNAAYRFDRHERRSYFTLLKGAALHEALHRVGLGAGGMAVYAAFSAAERQAPHVRQPNTWLYLAASSLDSFMREVDAKEVDSGENILVLIPEDSGVFLSFVADSRVGERKLGCTDPVQTYVDLMHCGGRGEEAAKALLEQRILPAWKAFVSA